MVQKPSDPRSADRRSKDRTTTAPITPASQQFRLRMARTMLWLYFLVSLLLLAAIGGMIYLTSLAPIRSIAGIPPGYEALLFACAYLLGGLVVWLVGRRLTRPLHQLAAAMQQFLEGNWDQRARITRRDETGLLGYLFNQIADETSEIYRVTQRDSEQGSGKRQAFIQLSQVAISSSSLDELLRGALDLTLQHFNCACAAVYLVGQSEVDGPKFAVLHHVTGSAEFKDSPLAHRFKDQKIAIEPTAAAGLTPATQTAGGKSPMDWLVSKAILSRRPQVSSFEVEAGIYEAVIPLVLGDQALGALDLYAPLRSPGNRPGNVDERIEVGRSAAMRNDVARNEIARPFSIRTLSELQSFASVIALATANFLQPRNLDSTESQDGRSPLERQIPYKPDLGESDLLYRTGRQITQSKTDDQVIEEVALALKRPPADVYASAILLAENEILRPVHLWRGSRTTGKAQEAETPILEQLSLSVKALTPYFLFSDRRNLTSQGIQPLLVTDLNTSRLPRELLDVPRQMGCDSVAFLPVMRTQGLAAMLVLGRPAFPYGGKTALQAEALQIGDAETAPPLHEAMLGPYINLIELVVTTLERIQAQHSTQRRLAELQTLWNISQSIGASLGSRTEGAAGDEHPADQGSDDGEAEINLTSLYQTIHRQVVEVMGELSTFAIALYEADTDMIRIPYMAEEGQLIDIAPFPTGEGLTSIVIRSRRPLLLVEDTVRKSIALGAKTIGVPAKSWLGVPMLSSGEVVGAIIVQDIHREGRFDEEDERLLSTLATQVAVVVRNASLLEKSRRLARQERLLNEITARIRQSVDIQSILKTTASELGQALGATRAHIQVGVFDETPEEENLL